MDTASVRILNAIVLCLSFVVTTFGAATAADTPPRRDDVFRVFGYLPDYRVDDFDVSSARRLTDLVFFSVVPEPGGQFVSKVLEQPKAREMLKRLREDHQVKVHLCIGGWDRSQGFAAIAATEESRRRFATGLTAYCRKHQFAGADLDWEHPENAPEATNYGRLLGAIAVAFKPAGLRLTAAMAGWQTLTPEAIAAVDAIHLMSYDNPGKHSTFEGAKADVRKMRDQGLPASKIRLGLPFYGRGITERDMAKTYAGIVAAAPGSADTNESQGMYFNGPSMIRAKTRFAKDQRLGGVMIWEMGQDAPGDGSLLKVIDESIK